MVKEHIKKMFYIAYHQGNENQNHKEISVHSSLNGYYPKVGNLVSRRGGKMSYVSLVGI